MKLKHSTLAFMRTGREGGRRRLFMTLVSLGAGGCSLSDSKEPVSPLVQREARVEKAAESCVLRPPFVGNFEPEVQYAWTGSEVLPEHDQVMMTPVVVDVNKDGVPDIVFSTYAGTNYTTDGVLRAISGDDGHALWTVTNPAARVKAAASLAAGDLDGDGRVEVCGVPENGRGVICFEHDGTFKFRTPEGANDYNEWGGPSLADLDGDGTVEILDGNRVYTNTGALKWVGADGMGGALGTGPVSFAADVDGDGKQEVVNGRSVYRHDGTLKCANTSVPHGFGAVANFDADAAGEIVVAGSNTVTLLDDDCKLLWTREVHVTGHPQAEAGHGGPPNVADFDGDGQLDIGLAGDWNYTVYKADGSVLWSRATQDYSSGRTTSTTFDFEDDGKLEVVYADELYLRILDGATGAVRYEVRNSSGTTHEYPLVVDVDGDNAAELLVVTNNHAIAGQGTHGLRVFHDKKEGWARARRVWNQHAYSVTNVNDDGTIPAHPTTHWLSPRLNLFRSNVANFPDDGGESNNAPDLTLSQVTTSCDGYGSLVLSARVSNLGSAPVATGLKVSFYKGNPAAGGTLLATATVTDALPVGATTTATVVVASVPGGTTEVWAVADDDGTGKGRETECREGNNTASASGSVTCTVTPTNKPPVALCRDVSVSAGDTCRGSASVNNGSFDPDAAPQPLTVTESPAASFPPGAHDVVLTASDGEASAQCTGRVTVVDAARPVVECPASQVVDSCSPAGASATFTPRATDNCGAPTVTCSKVSGSSFPVGTTPVTCTAQDTAGNTSNCSFDVTVRGDGTPPVLACPTAPVVVNTCATAGATATFSVTATDTCGAAPTVTCSQASGSTFPVGTTPVTCTAQDASGNTSSCAFNVQVQRGGASGAAPVAGASKGKWLWAPNTRMVNVSLADCAEPAKDACGAALPLETYGRILHVSSDEAEVDEGFGDMPTCLDMAELKTTSVKLRAERTTARNGRVYTLHYSVTSPGGATSLSTCRVTVPQNPLEDAVDDGVKFCLGPSCPAGSTFGSPQCRK